MSVPPRPQAPVGAPSADREGGGGRRELAVLAVLLVVLAVPRLVALGADPPPDMMLDYLTDEGWWAHNARNHARFGRWIMDDHNEALIWAPLYTGALRGMYALFGVGLVPTRLLAALAGLATCGVVYAFVRASHGWKAAALATFLLGTDYFWLSNNRVGFVESFQALFITAACLAIVRAVDRPTWGFAGGALIVLALLAKVSAVVVVGVVLVFWVVWLLWRRADPGAAVPAFVWSVPLRGAAGAIAVTALAFVLVAPDPALLGAKTEQRTGMTTAHNPVQSLVTVGMLLVNDRIQASGFITGSLLLLVGAVVIAVRRIAFRARPFDALELMCWCWVVAGGIEVGMLRLWQPDRRFLFMVPPLAILVALELARGAAPAEDPGRPLGRSRLLAAAALIGLFVGFVGRGAPSKELHITGGGIGPSPATAIVWVVIALLVTPCAWMLLRRLATRRWPHVPVAAVLVVYALLSLGPMAVYLAGPTYSMREASRTLTALAAELPADRRVAVGDFADTLGMESDLFTFVIRSWPEKNMFMNLDGWERFQPAIALDEGPDRVERADFEARTVFALAPDRTGTPRRLIDVRVQRNPAAAFRER